MRNHRVIIRNVAEGTRLPDERARADDLRHVLHVLPREVAKLDVNGRHGLKGLQQGPPLRARPVQIAKFVAEGWPRSYAQSKGRPHSYAQFYQF